MKTTLSKLLLPYLALTDNIDFTFTSSMFDRDMHTLMTIHNMFITMVMTTMLHIIMTMIIMHQRIQEFLYSV